MLHRRTACLSLILMACLVACSPAAPTPPVVPTAPAASPPTVAPPAATAAPAGLEVPAGNPPVLDGTLSPGEWDAARLETMSDGSTLRLMHSGGYLYLAMVATLPNRNVVGSLCLDRGDEIAILHASAALGTAVYRQDGEVWEPTQEFNWRARETDMGAAALAAREEFLESDGWVASLATMGVPEETEYKIEMPAGGLRLAAGFNSIGTMNVVYWPAEVADSCRELELVHGNTLPGLRFAPETWALLTPSATPAPAGVTPDAGDVTVLSGGVLIDGTGKEPVPGAAIVIRAGRVEAAGPAAAVAIPAGARVIDVQGATVLPGFFNAHVHAANGFPDHLEAWAQAGVTTVCDLSPRGAVNTAYRTRDESNAQPRYARVIAASPILSNPGGYGSLEAATPDEARAIVDDLAEAGADLIKIGIEDSIGPRTWPLIPRDLAQALADEGHARGLPVVAHITRLSHVDLALSIGVDGLAHMVYDTALPPSVVTRAVASGLYWTPTLELYQGVGVARVAQSNVKRFFDAGGHIALGTDYAGYTVEFDLGMPITEIDLMRGAGMTPMQIIVAATRDAAHFCGCDDRLGTLEPGKIADVLVVNGDPLADLHTLLDARLVIRDGVVLQAP